MGATTSVYILFGNSSRHSSSKGFEFLRNVYATAGLSIAPKRKGWELDALKAFARGLGLEPEKVLTQAAMAEPHRAYATPEDREQAQTRALSIAIKGLIKKELQPPRNCRVQDIRHQIVISIEFEADDLKALNLAIDCC